MSGGVLDPGDSDTKKEPLRSLRDRLLRRKLVLENNQFRYRAVDAEGLHAGSRDDSEGREGLSGQTSWREALGLGLKRQGAVCLGKEVKPS